MGRPMLGRAVLARVGLALTAASAGGCVYLDLINERPSAEIERVGDGLIYRGDPLAFRALGDDPDGDRLTYAWRGQGCDRSLDDPAHVCSAVETGTDELFTFTVPTTVAGAPTTRLVVTLEVTDARGAVARPGQRLELPVANHPPTLELQRRGRELSGQFPTGVPIVVSARGVDVDGDAVALTWTLFPAATSDPDRVEFERLPDPATGGQAYQLIPDVAGEWLVRVDGSDGLDPARAELPILVQPDHAPCIGALDPPATDGAVVLLTAPRRFALRVVTDDLDLYPPPPPGDPYLGAAALAWSMRPAGATAWTALPDAGAAVDLDPGLYAPGDRLELRVEVADRTRRWPATHPACAPEAASCNIEPPVGCVQRRTWLVEVR
jgi:hypothetical protein